MDPADNPQSDDEVDSTIGNMKECSNYPFDHQIGRQAAIESHFLRWSQALTFLALRLYPRVYPGGQNRLGGVGRVFMKSR